MSDDKTTIPALPEGVHLTEGSMVPVYDHIGNNVTDSVIWIRVRGLGHSDTLGPFITGGQYPTEEADESHFEGMRSIPVSQIVDLAAEKEAKHAKVVKTRTRRTGGGMCEHCGERTGGGRFLPGHDAKLESTLLAEGTDEAVAESQLRAGGDPKSKWWQYPASGDGKGNNAAVAKLVKQGDGFLRSRIAARTGTDPGRSE